MTQGSIPGSRLEFDSALHPSEVSKLNIQLVGGEGNLYIVKVKVPLDI